MNFPVGQVLEEGLPLAHDLFRKKCFSLMKQSFTGYAAIAIQVGLGLEESLLLFRGGAIVGCAYELVQEAQEWFGPNASRACFNASVCPQGVMDIVSLSSAQVDLVTAFNESVLLPTPVTKSQLGRYIPKKFDSLLSKQLAASGDSVAQRKETFERFGLGSIFGHAKQ